MSYDLCLWYTDQPLEDEEAGRIYAQLVENEQSEDAHPSDRIAPLAKELQARWPDPPPGREDDSPWSAPVDVSPSHLLVSIMPSRLWDVWPILGELARQNELVMYDPQQQCVFLPPRLSQKRTRARAKRKREALDQG